MVNVMTYDLYGNWYNKVGHHSALYHAPHETGQDRELNTVRWRKWHRSNWPELGKLKPLFVKELVDVPLD